MFRNEYQKKLRTPEEAVSVIKSGDWIDYSVSLGFPYLLDKALAKRKDELRDVKIRGNLIFGPIEAVECDPEREHFIYNSWHCSSYERGLCDRGLCNYIPMIFRNVVPYYQHFLDVNVAMMCVTPMDEHGHFHLAPVLTVERDAIERAHTVVLEVSPHVPYTYGDTLISLDEVDYVVETDIKVPDDGSIATDETSGIIGEYIADLIHDGDCIQLGIGAIPNAVARSLRDKHHLGIHTELFVSSMAELMECGAVDNSRKNYHPGKSIACFTFGTQKLYDFIDHNPDIEFYRAASVIDPRAVMQNDNMVSVNTAFGCDLTGQVTSEGIGAKEYSGVGGQFATAKGAVWAKNGRSIIAFRSTANLKSGVVSNINASFAPGTAVTLSRNDVDIIVTEYGVAYLRGRSVHERVGELIRIAHPDFRDKLRYDVSKLYN